MSGEISVDPQSLDREAAASHTICINASVSSISASVRSVQWKVFIEVTDINDHKLTATRSVVTVGKL